MSEYKSLVEIYGTKASSKLGKPLKFDDFTAQTWYINPVCVNFADPVKRTIHTDDGVFRVSGRSEGFDRVIQDITNS